MCWTMLAPELLSRKPMIDCQVLTPAVKVTSATKASDTHLPKKTSQVPLELVSATPEVAATPEATESSFLMTEEEESSQAPRLVAGVYGVLVLERYNRVAIGLKKLELFL